jgi:hypothetical protein
MQSQEFEFINNLTKEGIILIKVKEIRKIKPTEDSVFDVEIPSTQMFSGGIGSILLHNTGGGIITGSIAAGIAAESITEHLRHGKPLKNYDKNLSALNKDLMLHWKIRKYLNSTSDKDLDKLFVKMKKAKIEQFLEKYGNMDHPSLFVGKLLSNPKIWLMLPEALKILR